MREIKKSSTALILAAWLLVAIPTAWGIGKTAQNAAHLFQHSVNKPAAPK